MLTENNTEFLEKVEHLFSYHPPRNVADQELHTIVNQASVEYAKALASVIANPAELPIILMKIQEARNLANFAISCERVGISYRDLFISDKVREKKPELAEEVTPQYNRQVL